METMLVTGAAGFIAHQVCQFLLDDGYRVLAIDNLNDYYDVSLKQHRLDKLNGRDDFEFAKMDIEDADAVDSLFSKHAIATVFNLAARAGVRYSMVNPHVYMTTNALGTLNLLESMRKHDVNKMVLASTSSLYAGQAMPFTESLAVNTPISPYAASKKSAEAVAHSYHHLYGMDISILRYFTVYGPAGRPDMCIFRFIKWIAEEQEIELFGDGLQARDFTYVDDIARGTIAARQKLGYEIINLGGGNQPVSLNQIIKKLEHLLGKSARINHQPFHVADIVETWADIEKAGRILGWTPKTDLDSGLASCVDWYRDHLPWTKQIEL